VQEKVLDWRLIFDGMIAKLQTELIRESDRITQLDHRLSKEKEARKKAKIPSEMSLIRKGETYYKLRLTAMH
jgi:hypothetical protein